MIDEAESIPLTPIPKINPNNFNTYVENYFKTYNSAPVNITMEKVSDILVDTWYENDSIFSKLIHLPFTEVFTAYASGDNGDVVGGWGHLQATVADDILGTNGVCLQDKGISINGSIPIHAAATTLTYRGDLIFIVPPGKFYKFTVDETGEHQDFEINNMDIYTFFTNIKYTLAVTLIGGHYSEFLVNGNPVILPYTADAPVGCDITLEIFPEGGYHVSQLKVDGVIQELAESYSFVNYQADHTVEWTIVAD